MMQLPKKSMLLVILLIVFTIFYYLYNKFPKRKGEISIPGLLSKTEVVFDKWGVPHIEGSTEEDVYRVLGYLNAQDRLFQMEMLRRLSEGRLSEVLGSEYLHTDLFYRALQFYNTAKKRVPHYPKDSQAYKIAKAYIEGVNHYIETGPTPIEFDLIGIPRSTFTAEDVASMTGHIALSFATALRTDPIFTWMKKNLDRSYIDIMERKFTGPSDSENSPSQNTGMEKPALKRPNIRKTNFGAFEGSNGWLISGKKPSRELHISSMTRTWN
ncbi:MAG: penicillin acylase family protein [Oligoflexales bacterium]|nr:penicillin acylase family protein [Oligoflexales bacterium]